jgi:hypothetical protein
MATTAAPHPAAAPAPHSLYRLERRGLLSCPIVGSAAEPAHYVRGQYEGYRHEPWVAA